MEDEPDRRRPTSKVVRRYKAMSFMCSVLRINPLDSAG